MACWFFEQGRSLRRACFALSSLLIFGSAASAQTAPTANPLFHLSESIELDRANSLATAELERAKAYLAEEQWSEAIDIFRRVMERSGNQLWPVEPHRFLTVRDYCQSQLAAMPRAALTLYRAQVDPVAQQWFDEGKARRDPALLRKVVDEASASRWGDDALWMLGDLSLDAGQPAAARAWWRRILPDEGSSGLPVIPDTNIDPAAVRARLVLASILEGSRERAAGELAQFARRHPGARGRLGGREVDLAATLRELLIESETWTPQDNDGNWLTFAGAPNRTRVAPTMVRPGEVAWRVALDEQTNASGNNAASPANARFHPIRVGPWIFVNNSRNIWALRLTSGKPAWSGLPAVYDEGMDTRPAVSPLLSATFGEPQYTLTAFDRHLYARMGDPITGRPRHERSSDKSGCLVCLDLAAEGRLLWKITPESDDWAFEGSPLSDGRNIYAALRQCDVQRRAYVACYDAGTGRRRWRRFVCAAQTPGQNERAEITHHLLTLADGTLYYNTNLGVVVALSPDDGRIRWATLYPRATQGDLDRLAPHWSRRLNPCIYDRGRLYVAPSDSPTIFAFDAANGRMLWQTGPETADAVHLLGVADGRLIASGNHLYWIGLSGENQGRVIYAWPSDRAIRVEGRGALAGRRAYVPADGRVYAFDLLSAELVETIDLKSLGVEGGNLLAADGRLLIASPTALIALNVKSDSAGDNATQPHRSNPGSQTSNP